MNPMERALADADKITAANAELERKTAPKTIHQHVAGMTNGQTVEFSAKGRKATVGYHSEQSYGDNGKPVPGAVIGYYTVADHNGRVRNFEHGPFATTPAAAKRGASRDSKILIAHHAADHVVTSLQGLFNDKRAR